MLEFLNHSEFDKETANISRRFRTFNDGLESFELICEKQFHPISPQVIVPPGKIHHRKKTELFSIWKIELVLPNSGLRPNQFPRVWFAVQGTKIAFLCVGTHIDNYSDNEMDRVAERRATDIF
ncbi:MAG: hypothetical protein HYT62_01260 [Candidatus Yanofskybacteria bacterium]|nr:hypothetical protein [Candidatus Yanofskybacteria bacterium]